MSNQQNQKGYLIIEGLLSLVIFTMVLLAIFSSVSFVLLRTEKSRFDFEAGVLAQEGVEIAYNLFLEDWSTYSDGTYFPALDTARGEWVMLPGTETNIRTKFTRSIEISRACRNPSTGELTARSGAGICPGEVDDASKIITTKIEWEESGETKNLEAQLLVIHI